MMLVAAPFLWAANTVVGRMVHTMVPPVTLNFLRWVLALLILLPLARSIYRRDSGLWKDWRHYAVVGLLGVGLYNALHYFALHTSTPINATLVGASIPVWMLLIGRLFFRARVTRRQMLGAALSIVGVLIVLSRGEWRQLLALRIVPGDIFMILATIVWATYSWLLASHKDSEDVRRTWATFMLAQVTFGLAWSSVFTAGEWMLTDARIHWSWPLVAAIVFVAVGPALMAYRFWGLGVQRVGPNIASFFNNLVPLFAALLSTLFLGELPRLFHLAAFALIVSGIVLSSRD
jgi:drug/metabolite transporter (DMT)-like permease